MKRRGVIWAFLLAISCVWATAGPMLPGRAHPGPQAVLPNVKREALLNGLQLIVIEKPGAGNVALRLRVNHGAMFDLAGKGGLADLTAAMLLKGGLGLSAKNVEETIEGFGLTVAVAVGWDFTDLNITGPATSLDAMFDLLNRVVVNPAFDQKELDAVKTSRAQSLKDEAARLETRLDRKALEILYGTHPFGRPRSGTAESIGPITRHDLAYYHKRYYLANNAALVVSGDTTVEQVIRLARARLGPWKKGEKVPATFRPAESLTSRRVVVIDSPDLTPIQAVLALPGVPRRVGDYYPALVAMELFSSRLAKIGSQGQGVSVTLEHTPTLLASPLAIRVKAPVAELAKTIGEILAAANDVKAGQFSSEQLESAKSQVINQFAAKLKTADGTADLLLDIELYGLGRDYLVSYSDRVAALSAADIQAAAAKYLAPNAAALVAAGPSKPLEEALKSFGLATVISGGTD